MSRYKYTIATALAALAALLLAAPVLAAYYADITVTESGSNSYDMLPVAADMDIAYLATNGYIETDGRDIRVKTIGGAEVPFMLVDDKVLFAPSIKPNRQNAFRLSTGNGLINDFAIVTGDGGYITIADHANLELSDDFEIEIETWIDTAGSVSYLYNEGALAADWVEGYSDASPEHSKESDHLKIVAYDWDDGEQGTYVTDSTVDLTNVKTLKIDWQNAGEDHAANAAFFVVSTVKGGAASTYDARIDKYRDFSRTWDELDVSDLTGSYYIRLHAQDGTAADNHAESDLRTYSVVAVGSYIVFKESAFYICIEDTDLTAHIAGGTPKTLTVSGISSAEYLVKVYADGSDFSIDIDGSTEDTVALAGASVPDNANDYILPSVYFNYYKLTTSDTLRLTYEPDDILIGTTLPNELTAGTYDGVITYGSAPSGISVAVGGLETTAVSYPTDGGASQDIIRPTTAPLFDVNLERLEYNPLRPVVVLIATEVNLTERLVWLGGGFFILFAVLLVVLWKSEGQITFTAFAGIGVCIVMYLLGIFPLWPTIVFGIGVVASFIWERVVAL